MKIIPFTVEVAQELLEQERHTAIGTHLSDGEICKLVGKQSFAGRLDDGSLVAACGIYEMWEGRALSWALMTRKSSRHMAAITRGVRRWLDVQQYRRVEATVELDFAPGHRWAQMLGFELEAPLLKAYGPDGKDHALYARVR